jgi:hypothetical protein
LGGEKKEARKEGKEKGKKIKREDMPHLWLLGAVKD